MEFAKSEGLKRGAFKTRTDWRRATRKLDAGVKAAYYRGDFDTQVKLLTQTVTKHNQAIVVAGLKRGLSLETAQALPGQLELPAVIRRCAKSIRKFYGFRNKPAGWYK